MRYMSILIRATNCPLKNEPNINVDPEVKKQVAHASTYRNTLRSLPKLSRHLTICISWQKYSQLEAVLAHS